MKKVYTIPVLLEGNGSISLTVSQAAALGIGDPVAWTAWWEESGDFCVFDGFEFDNPSTWTEAIEAGFDVNDPTTWDILIGF